MYSHTYCEKKTGYSLIEFNNKELPLAELYHKGDKKYFN
jgi:hypothetical protein